MILVKINKENVDDRFIVNGEVDQHTVVYRELRYRGPMHVHIDIKNNMKKYLAIPVNKSKFDISLVRESNIFTLLSKNNTPDEFWEEKRNEMGKFHIKEYSYTFDGNRHKTQ